MNWWISFVVDVAEMVAISLVVSLVELVVVVRIFASVASLELVGAVKVVTQVHKYT